MNSLDLTYNVFKYKIANVIHIKIICLDLTCNVFKSKS